MKKKILALILSGCIIVQNAALPVQAAELPLYTQTEADNENVENASSDTNDSENMTDVSGGAQESESENTSETESEDLPENESGENMTDVSGGSSDAEESDPEASDAEESDPEASDAEESNSEESDSETPDSQESAPEESDAEASDSEASNTDESPTEETTDAVSAVFDDNTAQAAQDSQTSQDKQDIQYAYVESQADTDVYTYPDEAMQASIQSLATSRGLYFGYVETDPKKHIGTLKEYISDSSSVTIPHKLGSTYMVEIGDNVFAGMNSIDPSDIYKLPEQSTAGKTLLNDGENKILELLNAERIKKGQVPLIMDGTLRETARCKTLDMFNRNYFSHNYNSDSDETESFVWLGNCYYPRYKLGEVIASNYESAERLYYQWAENSKNYSEMLDEDYRTVGIGVYKDGDGKIMGTQIFSSVIFQNIKSVTIEFGYEKIGNRAFENCSNLKSITIPSTVTEIAANAFDGCSRLTIYGKEGSYAQTYANAHNITFSIITEKSPIKKLSFDVRETAGEKKIELEAGDWDLLSLSISPVDYEHLIKIKKTETPAKAGTTVLDYQEDGTIHAISNGTAVITASAADLEDTCKIIVADAAPVNIESISFYDKEIVLYEGESIKPAYRISPVQTTDTLRLTSSNSSIFVVEQGNDPMITALKAGSAVLTVSGIKSNNTVSASASIDVRVLTVDEGLKIPEGIKAVTNVNPTLESVALPDGYSWKEPKTKLKANNKAPIQYFGAQYENSSRNILQDCIIPVSVSTVSGMLVNMQGKTLSSSSKLSLFDSYELIPDVKSAGAKTAPAFIDVSFIVDKPEVLNVVDKKNISDGSTSLILTPQSAGKCSVTVEVKIKDAKGNYYSSSSKAYGSYKKKYTFNVEDASYASDFNISLDPATQEGVTLLRDGSIQTDENATKFQLRVTARDSKNADLTTALKFKADKSGVVKVSAVKGQNGLLEVKVKKPGNAVITVTAKDNGKRSKDIAIKVKRLSPQMNTKSLTLNKLKPLTAAPIELLPPDDYPIKGVELYEDKNANNVANLFEIYLNRGTSAYEIGFKGGTASAVTRGSYKLFVKVSTSLNEYIYPITIKLKNTKPSVKFKQSSQINLFYKDSTARLDINTGAELPSFIEQINVANGAPHFEAEFERDKDGAWSALIYPMDVNETNYKKVAKTIELRFYYNDYGNDFSITKKVKINSRYKKVTLTTAVSQPVIYSKTGYYQSVFQIKEKESGKILSIGGTDNVSVWLNGSMNDRVSLTTSEGGQDIHIKLLDSKPKSLTANVMVSHDNWQEALVCPVKLNVSSQIPALSLDKSSITFNTASAGVEVYNIKASISKNDDLAIVSLRKGDDIIGIGSGAKKLLSEGQISIEPQKNGNYRNLIVCLNNSNVKSGTYKYQISARCIINEDQKVRVVNMTPVTLSIKVTNKQPSASLKAKGKINISNPQGTSITYTPKLVNAAGDIKSASLSGEYASQFMLAKNENGTYSVQLRENSPLGKGKYKLNFTFVLSNGLKVKSKTFTIKL